MLTIVQAETQQQLEDARVIFREYAAWLNVDLCFQGFEQELASLPGKYAKPEGRLYLAMFGEQLAGCIALRKLEEGVCEMKRLFVREAYRGHKIGVSLIDVLLAEARVSGYTRMRLDTFPSMKQAVALYQAYGFQPIAPYYHNPHRETMFLELLLIDQAKL
jgi:ribosomal protein S18 acetylase RimI-like enzyme